MTDFFDPAFTGERWAAAYDVTSDWPDPSEAVDFLAMLAPEGARVLELAVGGGRVALPLRRRGFVVDGIEASPSVVERLRAREDAKDMRVVLADMADVPVDGPYALVYVVWNSLFNLLSQQRQVDCFRNVARVLAPGGVFVVEGYVPDVGRYDRGIEPDFVNENDAGFSLYQHDRAAQLIRQQHVIVTAEGMKLMPVAQRYSWPSELDLMAQLAGLRLRERHADWRRSPFGPASSDHVSVYAKPAT